MSVKLVYRRQWNKTVRTRAIHEIFKPQLGNFGRMDHALVRGTLGSLNYMYTLEDSCRSPPAVHVPDITSFVADKLNHCYRA